MKQEIERERNKIIFYMVQSVVANKAERLSHKATTYFYLFHLLFLRFFFVIF